MHPRSSSATRLTVLVSAFFAVALALAVIPLASVSTYAAVSVLLLALVIVTADTALNAQPTGSLGQMLYETERRQTVSTPNRNRTTALRVSRW